MIAYDFQLLLESQELTYRFQINLNNLAKILEIQLRKDFNYIQRYFLLTRLTVTNIPWSFTIQHKFLKSPIFNIINFVSLMHNIVNSYLNKDPSFAKLTIVQDFITKSNLCFYHASYNFTIIVVLHRQNHTSTTSQIIEFLIHAKWS